MFGSLQYIQLYLKWQGHYRCIHFSLYEKVSDPVHPLLPSIHPAFPELPIIYPVSVTRFWSWLDTCETWLQVIVPVVLGGSLIPLGDTSWTEHTHGVNSYASLNSLTWFDANHACHCHSAIAIFVLGAELKKGSPDMSVYIYMEGCNESPLLLVPVPGTLSHSYILL